MKTRRTLRAVAIGCLAVGACASVANAQESTFTYGHIFISVQAGEPGCLNGEDAILEIDPVTGEWSFLADRADGLCRTTGLRFTSDGRRLLCLNADSPGSASGNVQSFNPLGASEIILDQADGLSNPLGGNGLVFDAEGNLYVVDSLFSAILRFSPEGGPASVFADGADGITGGGALDFGPNGELFYIGHSADGVIRITPDGVASVFDELSNGSSLVFDRRGNLFVTAEDVDLGWVLFRYDDGDPVTRRVLASGFVGFRDHLPLDLSPDETHVYLTDLTHKVYAVDVNDGTTTEVADFSGVASAFGTPFHGAHGIAVYAPAFIPTVSQWGIVSLILLLASAGAILVRRRAHASTSGPQRVAFVDRIVTSAVVRQNPTEGRKVAG